MKLMIFANNTAKQAGVTEFKPFYLLYGQEVERTLDTFIQSCSDEGSAILNILS